MHQDYDWKGDDDAWHETYPNWYKLLPRWLLTAIMNLIITCLPVFNLSSLCFHLLSKCRSLFYSALEFTVGLLPQMEFLPFSLRKKMCTTIQLSEGKRYFCVNHSKRVGYIQNMLLERERERER